MEIFYHPQVATWPGSGSSDDEKNFACSAPKGE